MNKLSTLIAGIVTSSVLLLGSAHAIRDNWPTSVIVGTASQGGTYFVYGSGWAKMIQENQGIPAGAEVTGGPMQNLALVDAGRMDFALTSMGPAKQSLEGTNPVAPGRKMTNVRALFPMYQAAFQIMVLSESGITSINSLNGKTMGVGPRAGTTATYLPGILKSAGVTIDPRYGGAGDQAGQVQDGLLESLGLAAGVPIAAFTQVEAQKNITLLGLSTAQVNKVVAAHPVSPMTIPAGAYKSLTKDLNTVSMWNFTFTHKDLPEDLAYEITKYALEHNAEMKQIHRAAAETLAKNVTKNTFLPLHPGAVRYYREIGIDLPASVIPAEMKK